jgi:hypothetical protein
VKKAGVVPESEEEAGGPKTPAKANNPKAKGKSDGNRDRVGSGIPKNRVVSEGTSTDLRAPLVSIARNFRKLVAQNAEFLEEFCRSQNTQLDLIANPCTSLREVPYQLHIRSLGLEEVGGRNTSEVSESMQQAPKFTESVDIPEVAEVAENAEVTEKVRVEGA